MKMDMNLFWLFVVLNVVNVVIQTIKSLATVKCGKGLAAIINALAYGFYTIVVVYMVCELPLWLKVVVVGLCNLVGVFVVKWGEELARKDKLWKVELTVPEKFTNAIDFDLKDIPHSYIPVGKHALFNFYCATQKESARVKAVANQYEAKYFVAESKNL